MGTSGGREKVENPHADGILRATVKRCGWSRQSTNNLGLGKGKRIESLRFKRNAV